MKIRILTLLAIVALCAGCQSEPSRGSLAADPPIDFEALEKALESPSPEPAPPAATASVGLDDDLLLQYQLYELHKQNDAIQRRLRAGRYADAYYDH